MIKKKSQSKEYGLNLKSKKKKQMIIKLKKKTPILWII